MPALFVIGDPLEGGLLGAGKSARAAALQALRGKLIEPLPAMIWASDQFTCVG